MPDPQRPRKPRRSSNTGEAKRGTPVSRSKRSNPAGSGGRTERDGRGLQGAGEGSRRSSEKGAGGAHKRDGSRSDAARPYEPLHLSDDVVEELNETARPGKGGILVEVFARAAAAFTAGDYAEAVRLGEQSKHIALRSATVREFLGLALYRMGRWKEAAAELSAFKRLTGSQEQNPVIADCYRALGRPERALEICGEIDRRRVPPGVYYEGVIVAAGALRDLGRLDEAMSLLGSLDLDPDEPEEHHLRARYVLADLLEHRGRFTQARKLFSEIAAVDPELTDAPLRTARLAERPPSRGG